MGLNWAAALDRVQEGVGKIASFKYDQFLRNDEKQRQDKMAEIAYQRQMNLARFTAGQQLALAKQSQEFTHGENDATRLANKEQADRAYQLDQTRLEIAKQQARAAEGDTAARNALLQLQGQQAKLQLDLLTKDADMKEKTAQFQMALSAAQQEMEQIRKYSEKMGMSPQDQQRLGVLQQNAAAASNAIMQVSLPSIQKALNPDQLKYFNEYIGTPKQDGTMPTVMEAINASIRGGSGGTGGAPTPGAGADPFNGREPPMTDATPAGNVGSAFWDTVAGGSTGAKLRFPDGSEQPMPGQDFEPSLFHMIGEPVRALGGIEITNGASMAAGDALLQETPAQADADPLAGRNARASIAVAMKKLEVPTQKELAAWDGKSSLSDNAMKDIQVKGYDPNTFMSYLRR